MKRRAAKRDQGVAEVDAEHRFHTLLESAPDAMVIVDRDGRIVRVNEQAEAVFGYARGDILGQPVEILVPERFRSAHVRHRQGYFRDPRKRPMGVGLELYGRRKDGTEFPVEISLSPMGSDGELLSISAIRDVTSRRAEEERAQLLMREQAARAALEDAVRVRDEFLSVAAHELKTPITSLRAFAELLIRDVDRKGSLDPSRFRRGLERIDAQSRKLTTLIAQLLDVSRIQAGHLSLELADADLVSVVRDAVTAVEAVGGARSVGIEAPPSLRARVDPIRFEQVLTNLLDNAAKYAPPPGRVVVRVVETGGDAEIVVSDEGPGIDEAHRVRIFDPFYRVDGRGPVSGIGLGLYVSQQIVEQHGGELRAEFPPDGGTRMIVRLPLAGPTVRSGDR
ncbi:MAG TPA: PAS domain-containing sensor histidine kinase [Candidatus Limnocylindria bacterium]